MSYWDIFGQSGERERSVEESEVEGKGDGYSKQVRWWWVSHGVIR